MKNEQNQAFPQLNPQQKGASEAPAGPLLIVAGAGTGKTRTLTARLAHFVRNGTPPERICAITFTNKAAKEMAERAIKLLNSESLAGTPYVGTFHSLGAWILRAEAHNLGRRKNFTIFDSHDSFDLIKKIVKTLIPKKAKEEGPMAALKPARDTKTPMLFAQKISEIKNKTATLADLERSTHPGDALSLKAYRLYEKNLEENNAFDFDDLIEKPIALFRKYPDILKKYQNKFDAVLVDEYQDVSPMQFEFVKLLAGEHRNVSVVGDDEQLIYGWRYANLEIFLNFEKHWPGARVVFLEENYRSTGNIIRGASEVSKNNLERAPKNLWTKNADGPAIKLAEFADEDEESEWIAEQIKKLSGTPAAKPERKDPPTIAILYRTNAQSRALEQGLIRRGIPYQIFGGLKFYERKEIKDIVAALRYFANPNDSVSRDRLEKNFSMAKFSSIEAIKSAAEDKDILPIELIERFLEATAYLDYIERNFANYSERQENVAELLHFAAAFKSIESLLQEIALVQATDTSIDDRSENANQRSIAHLSTIHLAKGLEFDHVFIAGCSEGLLPHGKSIESEVQLEEERRLMYVAMTRAKKELCISFYDLPSRFISEIPQEIIEFQSTPSFAQDENYDEPAFNY